MASAINLCAVKRLTSGEKLRAQLERRLKGKQAPLLAFRLPDIERVAWREGRQAARRLECKVAVAFARGATRTLRVGDRIAHDAGSDVFLCALLDRTRSGEFASNPSPADCRNAVERIALQVAVATERTVQSGWTFFAPTSDDPQLGKAAALALERGARERERYAFFSTVGHELRTPLTSIRGYLETVLDEALEPAAARLFLETAREESIRLGRLVDGMLDISLLDLAGAPAQTAACRLDEGLRAALRTIAPLARARCVTIEIATTVPAVVAIEEDRLVQALVNLLDNAVKHGRTGGSVRVALRASADGLAHVEVEDDGLGVREEERAEVFRLHVRGSSAAPGSGLGLAVVRMIVERCGGGVEVGGSRLGGARFTLHIPMHECLRPTEAELRTSAS